MNRQPLFRRVVGLITEEYCLSLLLALLVIDLLVLFPTTGGGKFIRLIDLLIFSLILLSGFFTMARHRSLRAVFAVFLFAALVIRSARILFGLPGLAGWDLMFSALAVLAMLVVILTMVYRDGPVTAHRIRGAIAAYLLLAVLFGHAYALINNLIPGALNMPLTKSGEELAEAYYYFSVVTLTTVGFGDITAVNPTARSLVMLEALIGQLYPAILIARLVTLEIESRHSRKD